jgi:hypothetical protein
MASGPVAQRKDGPTSSLTVDLIISLDGYPDVALELVESRLFDGRLQLLEYVPTVLDGPPGDDDRS